MISDLDSVRIERVVANLLTNALKYASGQPIKIASSTQNKKAVFTIEDHGPSISTENLKIIFNRYERIQASSNIGGLGLGLYISKQIVESHGGSLQVESTQGKGTKFLVELPII